MDKLYSISNIKKILEAHNFTFSKSLGQNFLINPDICPKMAQLSRDEGSVYALEIGPGIGVLTNELAKNYKKVVSIELDKRLFPVLAETLSDHENIKIINGDVLKLDLNQIIKNEFEGGGISVCANLPYYITSPVIMKLLEEKLDVASVTVMVQKEAAARLCAPIGSRQCGAVTLAVAYYAEPQYLFSVSSGSFYPSPKVDSAVIKLNIRKKPPLTLKDEKLFFKTVRAAFSQRRKTLPNSLSAGLGINKSLISEILQKSGIKQTARAEEISLLEFGEISEKVGEVLKSGD